MGPSLPLCLPSAVGTFFTPCFVEAGALMDNLNPRSEVVASFGGSPVCIGKQVPGGPANIASAPFLLSGQGLPVDSAAFFPVEGTRAAAPEGTLAPQQPPPSPQCGVLEFVDLARPLRDQLLQIRYATFEPAAARGPVTVNSLACFIWAGLPVPPESEGAAGSTLAASAAAVSPPSPEDAAAAAPAAPACQYPYDADRTSTLDAAGTQRAPPLPAYPSGTAMFSSAAMDGDACASNWPNPLILLPAPVVVAPGQRLQVESCADLSVEPHTYSFRVRTSSASASASTSASSSASSSTDWGAWSAPLALDSRDYYELSPIPPACECAACGRVGTLAPCPGCDGDAAYCDAACRAADARRHDEGCVGALRPRAEAGDDPGAQVKLGAALLKRGLRRVRSGGLLGVEAQAAEAQAQAEVEAEAARWFRRACDSASASGCRQLGKCYSAGKGVPQDKARALRLYRLAAKAGDAEAQFHLACCLDIGVGTPADGAAATLWYSLAAAAGHAPAQHNLAYNYANGLGVARDAAAAEFWYLKASAAGHADAQCNLGNMYAAGDGVTKDAAAAVALYRRAAAAGHAGAQFNLGNACITGEGTAKDPAEAVRWYRAAAHAGHNSAQQNLASCYYTGTGVPMDRAMSAVWMRLALEGMSARLSQEGK